MTDLDVFEIDSLTEKVSEFWSEGQSKSFSEALCVGLEKQGHNGNTILNVTGDKILDYQLVWNKATNVTHRSWQESTTIAENAAIAIAFYLVLELTDFQPSNEAIIGTGVDYWLGYKMEHAKYDEDNFLNARLEVSGINKETSANKMSTRIAKKLKQTEPTDNTKIPAYVCVAELSNPKAYFTKK